MAVDQKTDLPQKRIGILGLGYVGLPLAVAFGAKAPVVGFDINADRIAALKQGRDETGEIASEELQAARHLELTDDPGRLSDCQIFIVTVPTPVDGANRPDLELIRRATQTVAKVLKPGDIVVYESTVYPGCTRNFCVPILEEMSGLKFNTDFFAGYSPERINPGDREHRLAAIVKVTSGSTPEIAAEIDSLYAAIIPAGTFRAESIEVAEAAKVIENTQRDLNIALMNELSIIFHKLGIDTNAVLETANTKWNFLPFRPGLVGGHCIGVDPYYLTHRAQEIGYHPEVILAGRRINDGMGSYVADRVARLMMQKGIPVVGSRVLVLGLAFKENCSDLRNSKVIDVIRDLEALNARVDVYDPLVSSADAKREFDIELVCSEPEEATYDAVVLSVVHQQFREMGASRIRAFGKDRAILFDVRGVFAKKESDGRL